MPKGVALTRCGVFLLEESRNILTACRNLDRRINHLEEETPVQIVSSITIASFLLTDILCKLKKSSPNSSFTVQVASANAACAPDFPLPVQAISPSQLCRYPLLLREQGSAIRDTFDHTLALANQKAEPIWESVNSLALIKAAEAGLGITILPEKLLSDSLLLKKLRLIDLENMEMENQMLAFFHKDKYITKPLQILIDQLKDKNPCCSF